MTLAAIIVGICLILSELIKRSYHMKPRMSLAQFTVQGNTEEGEVVGFSAQLFVDETPGQHTEKMQRLYALREERLRFQNERLIKAQKEAQDEFNKAKAAGNLPTLVKNPE